MDGRVVMRHHFSRAGSGAVRLLAALYVGAACGLVLIPLVVVLRWLSL